MDSSVIELRLSELRRELEEILAMLASDSTFTANQFFERAPSETLEKPASAQTDTELLNDALVVITEFGEATPEILQMWLSIDFNRAVQILTRLETDGLISPKGKVRHKAFELLRSTLPVAD
jgi:DNA segregation ATPase FtsK/SpoIIIE-like protein